MQSRFSPARTRARRILQKCGILTKPALLRHVPVDLPTVCRGCGIDYQEVDYFPEGVDALIIRSGGGLTAVVNSNSSVPSRRFSLAHQLGHFFLHRYPTVLEGTVTPGAAPGLERECEADAFAVELLAPFSLIDACLRTRHSSSADIARVFLVGNTVARLALANYLARFPLSPVRK